MNVRSCLSYSKWNTRRQNIDDDDNDDDDDEHDL